MIGPLRYSRATVRFSIAYTVALALTLQSIPVRPAAAAQAQAAAAISGSATTSTGQTVANVTVQLRNLATGQLAGSTTSTVTGSFSFTGIAAGNYAVEVVNAVGQVIGTSSAITATAGAAITGVTVTASAAAAAAAAGAGAAAAA